MEKFLSEIDSELTEVVQRETKSVLRDRGFPGLATHTFEEICQKCKAFVQRFSKSCP